MPKVLLVEDDFKFAELLVQMLSSHNYVVDHVGSGVEASDRLDNYAYDIVILDWQLPDASGLDICSKARGKGLDIPVLMLTAMSSKQHKVTGLDEGADDFLTKPCDFDELLARLRALVRRTGKSKGTELSAGALKMDPATHKVTLNGKDVLLSRTEFMLLEFLLRHPGQIFDAEALLNRVWSSESEVSRDLVKVYIGKLRTKLKVEGEPPLIVTVYGVGYRLDPPI